MFLRLRALIALALVVTACAAAPSPSPTAAPSGPPTSAPPASTPPAESPAATASATAPATPTLVPSATAPATPTLGPTASAPATPTVGPTVSASSTPQPTAGEIDHPTDASTVVLRAEQTDTWLLGLNFARGPEFTLYGDGTVIYRPLGEQQFETSFPPMQVARMDEDQIQALLRFALGPGRLLDARPEYPNPLVADAPSTVFTLAAGEYSKTVRITALDTDNDRPQDQADLNGFRQLDALLGDFGKQVAAGQATGVGRHDPDTYTGRLYATEPTPEDKDWPWPELKAADLLPVGEFGGALVTLTPAQAAKVIPDPGGGALISYPVRGPDDRAYILSIRPHLPDDPAVGT